MLFLQPNALDDHPPIDRLHHVIDCQCGDGSSRQRFHLYAGPIARFYPDGYIDGRSVAIWNEVDVNPTLD